MRKKYVPALAATLAAAMLLSACAAEITPTQAPETPENRPLQFEWTDEAECTNLQSQLTTPFEQQPVSEPENEAFVRVMDHIPELEVALQYATENNITGQVCYDFTDAYLRYGTVKKLKAVWEAADALGYSLRIWDAFRPTEVQYVLWDAMPNGNYIANPYHGYSDHARGNCVDITLIAADGSAVEMPTGFDDFTARADRDYSDVSAQAAENARLLENLMTEAGFVPYQNEWWHFTDENDYPVEETFYPPEETAVTVSAIGDNILATGYGFLYNGSFAQRLDAVDGDLGYFFSGVYDILSADDFTIANAENVFTTQTARISKPEQSGGEFWFRADPENAAIFAAGSVEAAATANNHSHDYGQAGYEESVAALQAAGVTTFGYDSPACYEIRGKTFALLNYNVLGPLEEGVDMDELRRAIAEDCQAASETADAVVVYFHWGEEDSTQPDRVQVELAHLAADYGADLILGAHPHVLQPIESYNGAVIAYSLGNFVYGGAQRPSSRDTMILSVQFRFGGADGGLLSVDYEEIPCHVYSGARNDYRPTRKT